MTRVLGCVVAAVLVAGCGAGAGPDPDEPAPLPPINGAQLADDPATAAAVRAMTEFGYRLYRESSAADRNAVLSPLSIATAFGMARAGAGGATAAELDKVFGFPAEGPHAAFNGLIRAADNTPGPPPASERGKTRKPGQPAPPVVNIANGMFIQNGFGVKEPFANTLGTRYGARARPVDFASDGIREIDKWASEQTAGRIKKVFQSLDPATKVVLANAVYLKADWRIPFREDSTGDATFTRADRSTVRAPMMNQVSPLRYASGTGWQAVELPYAGDQLAMWILVPDGNTAPAELLAPANLAALSTGLRPGLVDLSMPRWDFGASLDLVEQLGRLGLRSLSDFSGIADGVFLSQAVHKVNITVDEWGTEAAAVTATAFATSAPGDSWSRFAPTIRSPSPSCTRRLGRPCSSGTSPTRPPPDAGPGSPEGGMRNPSER